VSRRHDFGRAGEDAAAGYLRSLGFAVLRRNQRGPDGEIDIIALDGTTFVFVEVKARRSGSYGSALGAVDARKRRRLRAAAADYLQFVAPQAKARFDVLTFDGTTMRLHRNAFS